MRSDTVEVEGLVDERQSTADAYRFTVDGEAWTWLPRSLVEWEPRTGAMTLPEWLAVDRGLV